MKSEEQVRSEQNATPAGKLLLAMGREYYDTESSARRVAEYAVEKITSLEVLLAEARAAIVASQEKTAKLKEELNRKDQALSEARLNIVNRRHAHDKLLKKVEAAKSLSEGTVKSASVNETPTAPKPDCPPPAQTPQDECLCSQDFYGQGGPGPEDSHMICPLHAPNAHLKLIVRLAESLNCQTRVSTVLRAVKEQAVKLKIYKDGLHQVSLASSNSMCSKEECGRIARNALEKAENIPTGG